MRGIIGPAMLCVLVGVGVRSARGGEVVTDAVQASDGVRIVYDVRGEGETALVFVHCWACDREFWREQVDVFAKDYRVVSLDLGGHGESGDAREAWSVAGLAGDVNAVVDKLKLQRVILIGHSMGGPVALESARLMPKRVIGIVAVDTMHNAEFEFPEERAEQMAARYEADFERGIRRMVPAMFPDGTDPAVIEWVIAKALKTKREPAVALLRSFAEFKAKESFAAANVPIRVINAAPSRPGMAETEVEINRKYADFDAILMDGVGHYPHLQKPEEFNAILRAVVQKMAK